jgi:predicted amidohydrolase
MARIGMAQMLVEGGKPQANLARACDRIAQAAVAGCGAVVLPECLDLGWTHGSATRLAQPVPGPHSDLLVEAAVRHGVIVVAGLVERSGDGLYNAAVLIDRDGQILLHHHKINELDFACDLYSVGGFARLDVARTQVGVIGINICADNFPEALTIGSALGRMGAKLLLSPCAWAVDPRHDNATEPYGDLWRTSYRQLATRYGMTVIGVSNVGWIEDGPWRGRKCIGCSLAIGPDGREIVQGPYGPEADELIVIDVH